jgi:hypothetical protein
MLNIHNLSIVGDRENISSCWHSYICIGFLALDEIDGNVILNGETIRIWKEAAFTCLKVLSYHSFRGAEKNNENTSHSTL